MRVHVLMTREVFAFLKLGVYTVLERESQPWSAKSRWISIEFFHVQLWNSIVTLFFPTSLVGLTLVHFRSFGPLILFC